MENKKKEIDHIISRLDSFLHRNDYSSAETYLLGVLDESSDDSVNLAVMNELMGLSRKLGKREQALYYTESAISLIDDMGATLKVGSATIYLNCATVYKAFGMAEKSIPLFLKANEIYSKNLSPDDIMWGGLYNNMALAYVDLKDFVKAKELYLKAIDIMLGYDNGAPEAAITYLNLADTICAEKGLLEASDEINIYLDRAQKLLDEYHTRDGNYAFVCEKCASVFGYYGRFVYEAELKERADRIYNERS